MSTYALGAVWKYARAKGSALTVLLYLAECAQMDGCDAYPGVRKIAERTRLTERGVRGILHELERAGEIVIHHNRYTRRLARTPRGVEFYPQWFIDVRCASDQEAYLAEGPTPKQSPDFPDGPLVKRPAKANRKTVPDTQLERFSGYEAPQPEKFSGHNRNAFPPNRNAAAVQPEKTRTRSTRKDPSVDPLRILEAPALRGGGVNRGTPPPADARSKHPVFKGQQLLVFDWMLEDLLMILGAHADAFDLHAWFYELDARVVSAGVVLPQRDKGAWLQAETVKEAMRRGLPVVLPEAPDSPRSRISAVLADARARSRK